MRNVTLAHPQKIAAWALGCPFIFALYAKISAIRLPTTGQQSQLKAEIAIDQATSSLPSACGGGEYVGPTIGGIGFTSGGRLDTIFGTDPMTSQIEGGRLISVGSVAGEGGTWGGICKAD